MSSTATERIEEVREIISEVLELEPGELTDDGSFVEDYGADSLRAIEILAQLEKKYGVEIPQTELPNMTDVNAVMRVIAERAGW
ncbi:MAG: acyl carrier protein [Solirubrobacteraceae bacterium]